MTTTTIATTTGTKNPVPSFDDGSSYATRSRRNTSNLFFPLGEKQATHVYLSYKGLSHKGIIARYNDNGVTWMVSILNEEI
jgi:hypothetical protein